MILAIGNSECLETEAYQQVRTCVHARGSDMVLFKQNKCLDGEYLVFQMRNGKPAYVLIIDGKEYPAEGFSSVWYMHPTLPKQLLTYEPETYRTFISTQFLEMRRALWSLLRDRKWLNDPWQAAEAESKIVQLVHAGKAGFRTPETVITSDPERVKRFYEESGGRLIVKTLGFSPIPDHVIYTNEVTPERMNAIDSVKLAPSIFQARVLKEYELRVTVVGERVFPVRIASQEDELTALDWRAKPKLNDFEVRMEPVELPEDICQRILAFMRRMGLRYGCLDIIVTPSGEYVFLEVNPNGQWYFVQLRTGVNIAEAIAEALV